MLSQRLDSATILFNTLFLTDKIAQFTLLAYEDMINKNILITSICSKAEILKVQCVKIDTSTTDRHSNVTTYNNRLNGC